MRRILIIKTSSMGDIIQTLPALTDAVSAMKDGVFDWVVEEAFAEIPSWHPNVDQVIPVMWRRLRKHPFKIKEQKAFKAFIKQLRQKNYDYVIDAQGLMKSAIITRLSKGMRCGLDWKSAWEPLASLAYQKKIKVQPELHAITRMRQLFSRSLGYPEEDTLPDYGLAFPKASSVEGKKNYLLFIHGTTWETKEWPEAYWTELTNIANKNNYEVFLPWGNDKEKQRAERIGKHAQNVSILPRTSLTELANLLACAKGVVSVDTGLGHLAAALNTPTLSLYGPTHPEEVGAKGRRQQSIQANFECSPCWSKQCGYKETSKVNPACFASISPPFVWEELLKVMQP